jgi:ectoine hydroxylase-related dioxygenase (phytanoyl-CoA dioxygenase family)
VDSDVDRAVEEVTRLGFAVFDAGLTKNQVASISERFDAVHKEYTVRFGADFLRSKDEHNTVRLPLALDRTFLDLARTSSLLSVIGRLIAGKYVLNQQNGIINPVNSRYNQDAWHRDLPYQHFVSSRPIAVNALFCVDEFSTENGGTSVLPASHLQTAFPSGEYIARHSHQVTAPSGSFIILDCMTFHKGERNHTQRPRRAVNHVFTIPFIKQQISIPSVLGDEELEDSARELLGYRYQPPLSVDEFIRSRS